MSRNDGGQPSDMVYEPDQLRQPAGAVLLAKEIGALLEKHYAGHKWFIEVDNHGGIIKLWAGTCSGQWGYIIKLADVQNSPGALRRAIVKAGGEMLERFHQPVGSYNREAWLAAPRDINGNIKPYIDDKPKRVRKRARDDIINDGIRSGNIAIHERIEGQTKHIIVATGYRTKES